MKLGVAYIAFDGVELLEYSIRQIRKHVDYIAVIYQEKSWFGKSLPKEDLLVLQSLQKSKLIDELILFNAFTPLAKKDPSSITKAKGFERTKRQHGLLKCLARGCTHYLCMDVDEFYVSEEFFTAKQEIIKNGHEVTAVRYINYVNVPTVHRGMDASRVPFICKISHNAKMGTPFFVKCDPTRGVINGSKKTHDFSPSTIKMHHMETVRRDLLAKYDSTTRAIFNRSKTGELISSIKSINSKSSSFSFKKIIFPGLNQVKLTHCENLFGIPYETWKK
jgi:hypothetical protein